MWSKVVPLASALRSPALSPQPADARMRARKEELEANGIRRGASVWGGEETFRAGPLRALFDPHQTDGDDRPVARERVVPCLQEVLVACFDHATVNVQGHSH